MFCHVSGVNPECTEKISLFAVREFGNMPSLIVNALIVALLRVRMSLCLVKAIFLIHVLVSKP